MSQVRTIEILQTAAMPTHDPEAFDRQFQVHRHYVAADPIPADIATRVRAIAAGGPRRIDAQVLDACPEVAIIANFGVGVDRVDVDEARRRGIVVTNTPHVLTEEVADFAMALLLATIRRIPAAERFLRDGLWQKGRFPFSPSLRGRTVGILGLGQIGKAIARRLAGFSIEVAYCGRSRQPDVALPYYPTPLELAQHVDTLIVVTPGGAGTTNLVDAKVLSALGPEGILVNISRGSVVDQAALIEALQSKRILTAGLDVFAGEPRVPPELVAMDNVVLTPHIGSSSLRTWQEMSQVVLDNLVAWFREGRALTPV